MIKPKYKQITVTCVFHTGINKADAEKIFLRSYEAESITGRRTGVSYMNGKYEGWEFDLRNATPVKMKSVGELPKQNIGRHVNVTGGDFKGKKGVITRVSGKRYIVKSGSVAFFVEPCQVEIL